MASSSINNADCEICADPIIALETATSITEEAAQPVAASLLGHELKTLVRQSSHYMAGLFGSFAIGFISFPIFTRALSISEYGIMDLGQRLLLMLTIASKLGLQNASLRFYNSQEFADNVASARRYYSTFFFGMLINASAVAVLFSFATGLLPKARLFGPLAALVYLVLGLALLRALASVLWGFLRIEERTKAFNVIAVAARAATIATVCALLPLIGHSAKTYFTGALGVETVLVVSLTAWLLLRGVLVPKCFDPKFFRAALAFGTPLVLYELAYGVLGSADRFLVRHYVGANALGFYSVAYGLANNVNELLVAPLSLALVPMYLRIWTSDGPQKTSAFLTVSFDVFIMAAIGMLAAVAATGHSLIVLLASSKYAGADRIAPVILAGLLIWTANVFVGAGLLIHKRTLQMAGLLVCSAISNILLNCLLLPRMGLMGGAIATFLSYLTFIILLAWASHRVLPLHVDIPSCVQCLGAGLLAWAVATQIKIESPLLDLVARSGVVLGIYFVVLYALNRRVRSAVSWIFTWVQAYC